MRMRALAFVALAGLLAAACGGGGAGGSAGGAAAGSISGNLTLWHSYHTGGSEEQALTQLIDKVKKDNANAKITVLNVPFDQIFNKYQTEVASGGGPDIWTVPNDDLGNMARANLLLALDAKVKDRLGNVAPLGIDGMKVDGKIYGIPLLFKAVALYYNKDKVATAPKTTDELMAAVKSGKTIVQNQNGYHLYGWSGAFGGKLMDDTGKCVADQAGWADAMQYLVDLKKAGGKFETDGGKADTSFRQGQVDMIVNGPWVLADYKKDLGAKLGVAPMPAGPKGKASPLTGVDGWYINPNSKNIDAAVNLGFALSDQNAQKTYADVAGDVPVRTDVTTTDPLVKSFAEASATGFPRPQTKEFGNYWGPFGDSITKIIEGKADPKTGVSDACKAMNLANKK